MLVDEEMTDKKLKHYLLAYCRFKFLVIKIHQAPSAITFFPRNAYLDIFISVTECKHSRIHLGFLEQDPRPTVRPSEDRM